jgi:hypothetical protein
MTERNAQSGRNLAWQNNRLSKSRLTGFSAVRQFSMKNAVCGLYCSNEPALLASRKSKSVLVVQTCSVGKQEWRSWARRQRNM